MVTGAEPLDDDDDDEPDTDDDAIETQTEPEPVSVSLLPVRFISMPTKTGEVYHVRAGRLHLGHVVSHNDHHLAVTNDGEVSEHNTLQAALKAVSQVHGLDYAGD